MEKQVVDDFNRPMHHRPSWKNPDIWFEKHIRDVFHHFPLANTKASNPSMTFLSRPTEYFIIYL